MEKDLCLDVALRLGKIIKQRLPGAEVVFTRSDDSFIPSKSAPPSPMKRTPTFSSPSTRTPVRITAPAALKLII
jgi:hypothetical protein